MPELLPRVTLVKAATGGAHGERRAINFDSSDAIRPSQRRRCMEPRSSPRPVLPTGHISRPRLEARLDAAAGARLTVVSGRAGVGKSVLISSWISKLAEDNFAWITLDADDNKPSIFWSDVATAVDHLSGDECGRFMTARADHDGYLVLDDAHMLMTADARRSLVRSLRCSASWMHLVLASRGAAASRCGDSAPRASWSRSTTPSSASTPPRRPSSSRSTTTWRVRLRLSSASVPKAG